MHVYVTDNEQPQCRIQIFPLQRLQNIMQLKKWLLLFTVKFYIRLLQITHSKQQDVVSGRKAFMIKLIENTSQIDESILL